MEHVTGIKLRMTVCLQEMMKFISLNIKGALCSAAEDVLMRRERSSLPNFFCLTN